MTAKNYSQIKVAAMLFKKRIQLLIVFCFSVVLAFFSSCISSAPPQADANTDVSQLLEQSFELLQTDNVNSEEDDQIRNMKIQAWLQLGQLFLQMKNREKSIHCHESLVRLGKDTYRFPEGVEKHVDTILAAMRNAPEPSEDQIPRDDEEIRSTLRRASTASMIKELIQAPKNQHFYQLFTNMAKDGVEYGLLDETLELVNAFPKDYPLYREVVFPVLCLIRNAYSEKGEKVKAANLHKRCEEMLSTFPQNNEHEKKDYLRALIRFGETEKAWTLFQELQLDQLGKSSYLRELVYEKVRAKDHARALELVNSIPDAEIFGSGMEKLKILLNIVKRQIESGELDAAETTLLEIKPNARYRFWDQKLRAYCLIAKKREQRGNHPGAIQSLEKARLALSENDDDRAWVSGQQIIFIADAMVEIGQKEEAQELLMKTLQEFHDEFVKLNETDPSEIKGASLRFPGPLLQYDVMAAAQSAAGDRNGCLKTLEIMAGMIDIDQPNDDADPKIFLMAEFAKFQVLKAFAREGFSEEALAKAEMLNNPLIKAMALNDIANTILLHRKGKTVQHEIYRNMIKEPLHDN